MINYIYKGDDFDITEAIREYASKRFAPFEKFVVGIDSDMEFVLSRNTAHDRPRSYKAEVKFKTDGEEYFVSTKAPDLNQALDMAKDELWQNLTHTRGKKHTLFVRGARKIKKLARSSVAYFKKK